MISFKGPFTVFSPSSLPLSNNIAIIAPFWDDVNTNIAGQILYRFTTDVLLLNEARLRIDDTLFSPTLLFIATWNMVAAFSGNSNTVSAYKLCYVKITNCGRIIGKGYVIKFCLK